MRIEKLKRIIGRWLLMLVLAAGVSQVQAQTVSFNFSATSSTWAGWVNVAGDPSVAVQTATVNGITISSVATANWVPWSGFAAQNSGGYSPGHFFPARVMDGDWFNYNGTGRSLALYNVLTPQLKLSGLNPDSTYILVMSSSDAGSFTTNPTVYTVIGATSYGSQNLNIHNNLYNGVVFAGVTPDSTGVIRIYVNATTSSDLASICGIQIYPGYYGVGSPSVQITTPANGAILGEGNNVVIKATAEEARSTISKVEFYADTTKIGEVDTVPYIFTWVDPDPNIWTITAKATDSSGVVNSEAISIDIESLNYFWSTTGNIGNNADSTFIGNVDSVRLDFRTKDIQRMSISAIGNVGIGTISPSANLHTTGSVRWAGFINDSTSAYPRALVSDANGNLAYRPAADLGQTVGGGLGITGTNALTLGDSIAGSGPHSFTGNRYQNLNGYLYSVGGSVNDPVKAANFRWYNNGDLASGTTMDRSVNTQDSTGMRYYSKLGVLQLGASDRMDTMRSKTVSGSWQGSGVFENSDDSSFGKPKLINTIYLGDHSHVDTSVTMINSLLAIESSTINPGEALTNSLLSGEGQDIAAPLSNSVMVGEACVVTYPANGSFLGGYQNTTMDTTRYTTAGGADNQFGGLGQLVHGEYNKNRTPFGAALGLSNVDFTTLAYTGTRGMTVSGIAGYPLLAIGNSSSASFGSNAVTVLYNGRTQINTTGFTGGLTQTSVTPKAALEVVSTNSGVLFPLLTAAQQSAIATGDLQAGLLMYNSDAGCYQFYTGSTWQPLGVAGGLSGEWQSLGNNGTHSATNFVGTTDAEPLVFRTDNAQQLTVTTRGVVGIGTATPQLNARLAVNGVIYAQKIEAKLTGWPDYVFDRNYRLIALDSLGQYIRLYRHLPGMPSAASVRGDGLDLGDNQAALLQKVEELTLYLIAANKEAADRQREIDRLKDVHTQLTEARREVEELKQQAAALMKNAK